MKFIKTSILGTYYTIEFGTQDKFPALKDRDGYTDTSTKEIIVDDMISVRNDVDAKKDILSYQKAVMRHEIIHAYLYESGLDSSTSQPESWAQNEEMVDWFAIQAPKIYQTFKECDCLG